jgi:glucans biosynthesis protein
MYPAVSGKRPYRMHGGAEGSGAPRGRKKALKHGRITREAIEERRQLRALMRESHALIRSIK